MNLMAISDNIKKLRDIFDVTQSELGRVAGVTENAVSKWENGYAEPRMGAIERIAACYGITKMHIIEDGGMDDIDPVTRKPRNIITRAIPVRGVPVVPVPRVGRVHAGAAGDPDVYENLDEYVEIPQTYLDIDSECFVVDFEGDCMSKDFGDTTSLVVSPNSPFSNGSIVIAAIDGGDYVVRRMEQTARELRLKPNSWNPEYKDIVIPYDEEHDVEFKGKVLGCFRRFE